MGLKSWFKESFPVDTEALIKLSSEPIPNHLKRWWWGLFKEKSGYKSRFLIKVGEHFKSIQTNEISCFYILERATFIRTFSDNDYSVDVTNQWDSI